jgi:hypothetical protein
VYDGTSGKYCRKKLTEPIIPEKNKTGGIIGDPMIIPPLPSSSSLSPSPPAPEGEEEMPIPEDLKLPRIYGKERETSA